MQQNTFLQRRFKILNEHTLSNKDFLTYMGWPKMWINQGLVVSFMTTQTVLPWPVHWHTQISFIPLLSVYTAYLDRGPRVPLLPTRLGYLFVNSQGYNQSVVRIASFAQPSTVIKTSKFWDPTENIEVKEVFTSISFLAYKDMCMLKLT